MADDNWMKPSGRTSSQILAEEIAREIIRQQGK